MASTLERVRGGSEAFCTRHRITDVDGKIHHVVVVGDLTCEPDGAVTGTRGMHVEVTLGR